MPLKKVKEAAKRDARAGKSASTQAGEFIREEMHHIGEAGHAPKSRKQAIAIGLSEARAAGVKVKAAPKKGGGNTTRRK